MKNKDLKLSIMFTLIGLLAGAVTAMYQIQTFDAQTRETVISQLGSIEALLLVSAVQTGIFTFISCFVGLKLARKTNLEFKFKFDQGSFTTAVIIAFITSLIISGSDKFIFAKYLPENLLVYKFNLLYLLTGVLYGGILEELMMRLFLMSLLVYTLKILFFRKKEDPIPDWMYVSAIIVSSLLFAAGHLPAASQMFGLTAPMVTRILLLNSVGGLGFGYLYWKNGLTYSIIAHMLTHVFNQLLIMPLLF